MLKLTKEQEPFRKEIQSLLIINVRLKENKNGSTPEARQVRIRLRDFGIFVSSNDTREGQVKPKLRKPQRRNVKKNK